MCTECCPEDKNAEEPKVVEAPDVSNDTDAVKELYAMMQKMQIMYTTMSDEEKIRMDTISEFFFGD